jgi:hypothetical protein
LKQEVDYLDVHSMDADIGRGLQFLVNYTGDDVEDAFGLTFSATVEFLGEVKTELFLAPKSVLFLPPLQLI